MLKLFKVAFSVSLLTYPVDAPTVNLDLDGDGDRIEMGVNTTVMLLRKKPTGLNIKETKVNY